MEKIYTVDNDILYIDSFLNEIRSEINNFLSDEESKGFILGVYEMILNAIEHGNLGITYEMKKLWLKNNTYEENIRKLSKDITDKKVMVVLKKTNDQIIITIRDCGEGFNVPRQMEDQRKDNILRENGRGILIAKHFFSEVYYNNKGNEVTLIKTKYPRD